MNWQTTKGFCRSATLVLTGVLLVCFARAQDSKAVLSKDRPSIELDLHKFGYDISASPRRRQMFVDFTDASHLAVAWLTLDDPAQDDKTRPNTARPAHLHVLVLDATNGQKVGVQAWPTPSTPVRFLAARDGKFLTCTGNVLRLFSASFEVIRQVDLQNDRACQNYDLRNPRWGVSPSKRSLLLSLPAGQEHENRLLDVESLTVTATWIQKPRIDEISDHWLLSSCGPKREACIRGLDKPWQPFRPAGMHEKMNNLWRYSTRFVNDDTLVMGWWNTMLVFAADGTKLFQAELPEKRSFGSTVASSGGQRFAVVENRERGNEALDMSFSANDRAVVYSIPARHAIYAVKIKGTSPWTPWENHWNQLALSPDGTLLAVMTDATLRVYRLPGNQPAQH